MSVDTQKGKQVMPKLSARVLWGTVFALIVVQMLIITFVIHRESLTFDEGNHSFAGYMMWHTGDYGLNPEHPPLAKLVATLPLLGRSLWVPPLQGREFKIESYLDGGEWLARNDGDRNQIVFQMRLAASIFALALSLVVFFATRECFGDWAGLAALALVVFDPNILAHSGLVTTDIGITLFFLASTWCFYRYVKQPTWTRLIVAGLVAGLLESTKHSGILLAPILVLLIAYEVATAEKGTRARTALRLTGAFCFIVVLGTLVLWSFYGFRYAARPAGLKMSVSLSHFVAPLGPHIAAIIDGIARIHLLPQSYLIGLVDVQRMAEFYPTYIFGANYAHGVWWYFPVVILIKTTLGLLALLAVTLFAIATRKLKWSRELAFLFIPALFYLAVAMASGMNIGARHLLPFWAYAFVLAGAGAAALAASSRRWLAVCAVLLVAHVVSSFAVFPNYMAYANVAWGGPSNVRNLLSDANVDWGQQLFQVKAWQDRHPHEECWFAYFVYPEINPETYGIRCHHLPNADTGWLGGADEIPPVVNGAVLLSAGDLSGCEWPSASRNPYVAFQSMKPSEVIDYGVMVYQGRFDMRKASALAHAQNLAHARRRKAHAASQ